jgi:RNA polymerase sigma-70 factor (ECF subfamily)
MWLPVSTGHSQPDDLDVTALWQDMHAQLLRFISRRVPDRDSAEDILQEVMLRLHNHRGEVSASAVGGWIHEVARNAITDHYRRAVNRRERPTGSEADLDRPVPPAMPEPEPAELRRELAACLDPLVAQLPAIYRDALRLTDLDGLTQADAAALSGLSTSGMKARVQRPRTQLRQLLLRCCEIELDRRGGVIDYRPPNATCNCGRVRVGASE